MEERWCDRCFGYEPYAEDGQDPECMTCRGIVAQARCDRNRRVEIGRLRAENEALRGLLYDAAPLAAADTPAFLKWMLDVRAALAAGRKE